MTTTTTRRLLPRVRRTTERNGAAGRASRHLEDVVAARATARSRGRRGIGAVAAQAAAVATIGAIAVRSRRVVAARVRHVLDTSPRRTGEAAAAVPARMPATRSATIARSGSAPTARCRRRRRARRAIGSTRRRGPRRSPRRRRSTAAPSRRAPRSRDATATNSVPQHVAAFCCYSSIFFRLLFCIPSSIQR